ncbi:MAG: hypothetical protein IPL28_05585 [Chloroflexi bacterium]|nr:hypothetical protein [Chloroflexota bacterium]
MRESMMIFLRDAWGNVIEILLTSQNGLSYISQIKKNATNSNMEDVYYDLFLSGISFVEISKVPSAIQCILYWFPYELVDEVFVLQNFYLSATCTEITKIHIELLNLFVDNILVNELYFKDDLFALFVHWISQVNLTHYTSEIATQYKIKPIQALPLNCIELEKRLLDQKESLIRTKKMWHLRSRNTPLLIFLKRLQQLEA